MACSESGWPITKAQKLFHFALTIDNHFLGATVDELPGPSWWKTRNPIKASNFYLCQVKFFSSSPNCSSFSWVYLVFLFLSFLQILPSLNFLYIFSSSSMTTAVQTCTTAVSSVICVPEIVHKIVFENLKQFINLSFNPSQAQRNTYLSSGFRQIVFLQNS